MAIQVALNIRNGGPRALECRPNTDTAQMDASEAETAAAALGWYMYVLWALRRPPGLNRRMREGPKGRLDRKDDSLSAALLPRLACLLAPAPVTSTPRAAVTARHGPRPETGGSTQQLKGAGRDRRVLDSILPLYTIRTRSH